MIKTTVILGAGFSKIAGLPLTSELFNELPNSAVKTASASHEQIQKSWLEWKALNVDKSSEQWLALIYKAPEFAVYGATWKEVLHFMLGRVVKLRSSPKAAYYHGLTTPVANLEHRQFWTLLRKRLKLHAVVTTNYDILAEQGLLSDYSENRLPLFYYGGFPFNQAVEKVLNVVDGRQSIALGKDIVVCKLHGSLNWVYEPCGPDGALVLKIHHDVRAAVRLPGTAEVAIIPPLHEKVMDAQFAAIWKAAEESLTSSPLWIICGHALNPYDEAVCAFFTKSAEFARKIGLRLCIIDPNPQVVERWRAVTGQSTLINYVRSFKETLIEAFWSQFE